MIEVKTFNVDYSVEGKRLHGICRWIGNSLQVEMIFPFKGLVTHCHYDYTKMRLTDANVEGLAKHELKSIYMDIRQIADDEEIYHFFLNSYRSDRFRVMRKQAELIRAYKDLEMALTQKKITKREYRMQAWLIMATFSYVERHN